MATLPSLRLCACAPVRLCACTPVRPSSPERNPSLAKPRLPPLRLRPGVPQLLAPADPLGGGEALEHQLAGGHGAGVVRLGREAHILHHVEQAGDHRETLVAELAPLVARHLERAALVEPGDDADQVGAAGALLKPLARRAADQLARDGVAALQLALVLQLQLAGDRRD